MDASDSVEAIKARLWSATIDEFRIDFLRHFGQCTLISLQTLGHIVNLTPTPVAIHVQRRFMESMEANEADSVFPALHGTDPLNLPSIFTKGLLIGGRGGIPIRNGARYGQGVYVANMNAPSLAQGFVPSGQRLLVCAVLRSSEVTPHRDAQLVKNEAHVVPLFLASYEGRPRAAMLTLPAPVTIASFSSRCGPPEFCQLPPVVLRWMGHSVADLKSMDINEDAVLHAGYSASDLRSAGYQAADLKTAGYLASAMRKGGYSIDTLKDGGFSAADLRLADFSIRELHEAGFEQDALLGAGFSALDLRKEGYTAADLKSATYRVVDMKRAGYLASELKKAGYTAAQLALSDGVLCELLRDFAWLNKRLPHTLEDACYAIGDLQAAGYNNQDVLSAGYSAAALIKAGFAISTLKRSGYSAASLRKAGCSINDLLNAGYCRKKVLSAGYPAADLKLAGYCVSALVDASYAFKDLRAADYTAADLLKVGCSLSLLVDLGYSKADVDAACHACFWRSSDLKSVMQAWWKKLGYKNRCDYDESAIESWRSGGLQPVLSLTKAYFILQHSKPPFDFFPWRVLLWREQWHELQRQERTIFEASSMRSPIHWPELDGRDRRRSNFYGFYGW